MTKAKLIAAALVAALFFGLGWQLKGLQVKAAAVKEVKAQANAEVKQAERASTAVQLTASAEAKTEIRYVHITKEVEKLVDRPVYRNVCLDDDGLRAINSQILGFDPGGTGQAMSATGADAGHDGR